MSHHHDGTRFLIYESMHLAPASLQASTAFKPFHSLILPLCRRDTGPRTCALPPYLLIPLVLSFLSAACQLATMHSSTSLSYLGSYATQHEYT